jgi:hypothetical protein
MNLELAAAKGKMADLKPRITEAEMAIEEERRHLREATGALIGTRGLDSTRILFLASRLVKAIEDLKALDAEASAIREEYNL